MSKSYLFAFLLLFAWSGFAFYISYQTIEKQGAYGNLINLSGKQRMFSQKSYLIAHKIATDSTKESEKKLIELIKTMSDEHLFILSNFPSAKTRELYLREGGLKEQVEIYLSTLRSYLDAPIQENLEAVAFMSERLLPNLNEVVELFKDEHLALSNRAVNITLFVYIGTILTLFMISFFIIRPMLFKIHSYTNDLEEEIENRLEDVMVFSAIFENSREGMMLTDEEKTIIKVNQAFCDITAYAKEEALGEKPMMLRADAQTEEFYDAIHEVVDAKGFWSGEVLQKNAHGVEYKSFLTLLKLINASSKKAHYVYIFSNLTEMYENFARLQKLIDTQNNMLIITDGHTIEFANSYFNAYFGYASLELFLKERACLSEMFVEDDNAFSLEKASSRTWLEQLKTVPQNKRVLAMKDPKGKLAFFHLKINEYDGNSSIVLFIDVTDSVLETNELRYKSHRDKLTGCYNREYLYSIFESLLQRAERSQHKIAFILLDIDDFKAINDTYGHNRGDIVLKNLSKLFENNLRKDDIAVRWGGEEFLLVVEARSLEDALKIANTCRRVVDETDFEEVGSVTCSFGVSIHARDQILEETLEKSDTALYMAKRNGKNRVESLL